MTTIKSAVEFSVDDVVESGEGEDRDTGRVIAVEGDMVTVAWESGQCTTQPAASLV